MIKQLDILKRKCDCSQKDERSIKVMLDTNSNERERIITEIGRIDRDVQNIYSGLNSSLSYDAQKFLDSKRNEKFNNNVFSPICKYISCKGNEEAKLIKEVLNYYLLNGSLFTNPEDGAKARKICRDRNIKKYNIYTCTHNIEPKKINIDKIKPYNIFCTLLDIMEFEDNKLKEFLCVNSFIDVILIANKNFNEVRFNNYLNQLNLNEEDGKYLNLRKLNTIVVYSPTHRYQFTLIRNGRYACSSVQRKPLNSNLIIINLFKTKVYFIILRQN